MGYGTLLLAVFIALLLGALLFSTAIRRSPNSIVATGCLLISIIFACLVMMGTVYILSAIEFSLPETPAGWLGTGVPIVLLLALSVFFLLGSPDTLFRK